MLCCLPKRQRLLPWRHPLLVQEPVTRFCRWRRLSHKHLLGSSGQWPVYSINLWPDPLISGVITLTSALVHWRICLTLTVVLAFKVSSVWVLADHKPLGVSTAGISGFLLAVTLPAGWRQVGRGAPMSARWGMQVGNIPPTLIWCPSVPAWRSIIVLTGSRPTSAVWSTALLFPTTGGASRPASLTGSSCNTVHVVVTIGGIVG